MRGRVGTGMSRGGAATLPFPAAPPGELHPLREQEAKDTFLRDSINIPRYFSVGSRAKTPLVSKC